MAHVLVIDDEPDIRMFVATALQRAGHSCSEAGDGREAARLLRERTFDVVITDILMPERDGLETIMRLKQERNPVPVIAMSGMPADSAMYLRVAQQLGASLALAKPFTVDQLVEAVTEVLKQPRPT